MSMLRRWLEDAVADTRFALRTLRRTRGLAATAALILAVGIGGTTAMVSVADALLLRPLPLPNGERMVAVNALRGRDRVAAYYAEYLAWRERQRAFSDMSAYAGGVSLSVLAPVTAPVRATGAFVSANYFGVLGVAPIAGRVFREDEDVRGGAPVAIVSRGFAERELGGLGRGGNVLGK